MTEWLRPALLNGHQQRRMNSVELVVIRHGQSITNKAGLLTGQLDPEITDEGIGQNEALLSQLTSWYGVVYSSPLRRAYTVAESVSRYFDIPLVMRNELLERNIGLLAGRTWDELNELAGCDMRAIDRTDKYDYRCYGGESADQVKARLLPFLSELGRVSYERVIISCHGANIRMLYHLSGLALPGIGNGSIHTFLLQTSVTPKSTMPDLMAI